MSRISANKENRDPSPMVELPGLDLKIKSLQLPDVRVTETVQRSKLEGEKRGSSTVEVPFSCTLSVSADNSRSALDCLGLENAPIGEIEVRLQLENDALKCTINSRYTSTETRYETEYYNHHWVPEGQRYPYGPVEAGYMESDQREVPYEKEVERSEKCENIAVAKDLFNAIYLGVLNSNQTSPKREELITFLHENFRRDCLRAQDWIRASLAYKSEEAQREAERQAKLLEQTSLPPL